MNVVSHVGSLAAISPKRRYPHPFTFTLNVMQMAHQPCPLAFRLQAQGPGCPCNHQQRSQCSPANHPPPRRYPLINPDPPRLRRYSVCAGQPDTRIPVLAGNIYIRSFALVQHTRGGTPRTSTDPQPQKEQVCPHPVAHRPQRLQPIYDGSGPHGNHPAK